MIIGFLGKGGSGKSTLATLFIQHCLRNDRSVLAVDADHNMDLTYNLGYEGQMNYIGQGNQDILRHMEITQARHVLQSEKEDYFSLSPLDPVTENYSVSITPSLRLMAAGPHTEAMMYGTMCSHGLTQPLRTYLPFLKLKPHELAVVDEKAGADGVGTGVTVGFTTAVIVAEATPHGIKTAKQIQKMLAFYNTPYVYVLNKVRDTSKESLETLIETLGEEPVLTLPFTEDIAFTNNTENFSLLETLYEKVKDIEDTRAKRAKTRLQKLTQYEDRNP